MPPQRMSPSVGSMSPCINLSSRLLPAPFGPIITLMPRCSMWRSTPSITRRPPATRNRPLSSSGNSASELDVSPFGAVRDLGVSSISKTGGDPSDPHQSHIDGKGNSEKDDAQRERHSNIAFRGLQRNRGCHRSRHVIDIAADDHYRADLGDGSPEAGHNRPHQAK